MLKKLILYLSLFSSAVIANDGYAPNELIVKLADGANYSDIIALRENVNATVKKTIPQLNLEVWNIQDELGFVDLIQANRNIVYAEPNYIQRAIGTPNDARFNELWGMHNSGQTGGKADADIDAVEAWDTFTGSRDVVVAVIDTGVDYNHVDLADNRWVNVGEIAGNGIDDDSNGFIDDVYGYDFAYGDSDPMDGHKHGTHCSGTIGGVGDNGIGVAGVNHAVRIMAVKFINDWGSGYTDGAIDAITYAVDNGAHILSNSWGGGGFSQGLEDAISYANDYDVLFVAAAGNDGLNNDVSPHYPSNYEVPNVLAVAATDHRDAKPGWSNYGLTTVDLGAPGVDILSTVLGDSYDHLSGTSMATPHVAGAAALLMGYNPSLSALKIKSMLMDSVEPVASMDGKTVTGGRLNINNALLSTFNCSQVTEIPEMECEALVALYDNTDGDNWTDNSGWIETTTPICSWKGVKCGGGHVSSLVLSSNGLDGSIPADLSNLNNLKKLFLDSNELCGEIPVDLKNLSNITKLKLDNNHLTASAPKLIKWLDKHNPGWKATQTPCPQAECKLQFSSATYSIVENAGQATITVTRTDSSDGAVSVEYATSDDTATAPDDYTQTTGTLKWANGDDADKTFTIDIILDEEKESDESLIITLSNPTGSAKLGSLNFAELTINDVIDCATVSDIPVEECKALVAFYDSTNGTQWLNNEGWLEKNEACSWYGVTCSGGHVSKLWLSENQLTGSIPSELGNFTKLESLGLSENQLTGSIPTELGKLINLWDLGLSNNELSGSIPSELGKLINLRDLGLSNNQLTGSIPTELGKLINFEFLWLDGNELCGEIPVDLKNLSNIGLPDQYGDKLRLDNNHLTASAPTLIRWLNKRNPGWKATQTPCPQAECKLQFSSATYNIAENGEQITISVIRTDSSDGAVSVEYATSDDTATSPGDYTETSGTLNWGDGDDAEKTLSVDIVKDGAPESDETFIVSLGNPTGGAQLGEPDTATVTIIDKGLAFNCKKVDGISTKECQALVALYDSTNGENWVNNMGWKVTNTPCNWYGVTCLKKHVTGLYLGRNNLEGSIQKTLKKLKKLKSLLLNDNKLSGEISKSLMKLKKLKELDLNDNCLKTKVSKKLKKWLDEINPGWDESQTNCLY
ncbi:MAG: S8 family serine peptidase [Pseudomonadota bacterium]